MLYHDESHRTSNAESQSSTVRDFPKDDDTIMNLKDVVIIKEEEDNLSFQSLGNIFKFFFCLS